MHRLFPSSENYDRPPDADELEVSVIGPGFGECALVHLGDGQWLIVDSCIQDGSHEPAPLRYLRDLGVTPEQVRFIVVTHWDDDHSKGLAELVKTCSSADLVMSKAFVHKDFLAFVAAYASPLTKRARSGVKQIKETVEAIRLANRTVTMAAPARRLLSSGDRSYSHGLPVEVWTLSPSDDEYDNFIAWVAKQMPSVGETRRVAVKRLRNDLSVVVHISIGDDAILLGGDLEEEGKRGTGWSAILALHGRPTTKASVFKVPHHGSKTGHHDDVPPQLLHPDPLALVAPFKNGSVSLPTEKDVKRIAGFADAYGTTSLKARASPKRMTAVDKTIREVARRFTTLKTEPGLVRLRRKASESAWRVEMIGAAVPLAQML